MKIVFCLFQDVTFFCKLFWLDITRSLGFIFQPFLTSTSLSLLETSPNVINGRSGFFTNPFLRIQRPKRKRKRMTRTKQIQPESEAAKKWGQSWLLQGSVLSNCQALVPSLVRSPRPNPKPVWNPSPIGTGVPIKSHASQPSTPPPTFNHEGVL